MQRGGRANEISRAPCDGRHPADAVWDTRECLRERGRRDLYARYQALVAREHELREHRSGRELGINKLAVIDRVALDRALAKAAILKVGWRSVHPPTWRAECPRVSG
jgi:hypothetical protein